MQTNNSASTDNVNPVNDSIHNDVVNNELESDASFFDKPKNVKIIIFTFYVVCIVLFALDFVVHRHIYLPFEKISAFYAIYGFVACVVLVVVAKLMRLVVMRNEHYYDAREDEQALTSETVAPVSTKETHNDIPENMDELGLSIPLDNGDKS